MGYKYYKIPKFSDRNVKHLPRVREEYRHIKDPYKLAKQVALDNSDNGRCWWIYQYILGNLTHR